MKQVVVLKRTFVEPDGTKEERLLCLLGLLGQQHGLNVRQHAALGDGDTGQQLVELLVVAYGQLEMAGDDPALLVITGSVACELEHLGGQVLHDGGQVDGRAGPNALCVVALPQQTVDSAHRKLKSGPARARLALTFGLASFSASRHDEKYSVYVLFQVQTTKRHWRA